MTNTAGPGITPGRAVAQLKARLIARYKLAQNGPKPQELILPGTKLGVSIGYSGNEVRVRLFDGGPTPWVGTWDAKVSNVIPTNPTVKLQPDLVALLDRHFHPAPSRGFAVDFQPAATEPRTAAR